MKKVLFVLAITAFVSTASFAKDSKKDIQQLDLTPVTALKAEIPVATTEAQKEKDSDWAGFVCWLFGGHCQPL